MALAWGKTEEQKQADAAEAAAAKQAKANLAAENTWLASPAGRASTAKERGDAFFQLQIEVSSLSGHSAFGSSSSRVKHGGRPDLLGQIEDVGWHLEDVGYVFVETGSTSTDRALSSGQGTVTRGQVMGIYLFRNTDR